MNMRPSNLPDNILEQDSGNMNGTGLTAAGQMDTAITIQPSFATVRLEKKASVAMATELYDAQVTYTAMTCTGRLYQLHEQLSESAPSSREATAALAKGYALRALGRSLDR